METLLDVVNDYLLFYPEENKRQMQLINYLYNHTDEEVTDWNNFQGHVVASGFIYAKEEKVFLFLYHNDLKMYLYPGGHINKEDKTILQAARREVIEETGLEDLKQFKISKNELVPIDIDTHMIPFNKRLNLPEHYHFDFRYLFLVDRISEIKMDTEELSNYKWIAINELSDDPNYGKISAKLKRFIKF